MELIATDCTFNEACSYLAFKCTDQCEECIALSNIITKLEKENPKPLLNEGQGS